MTDKIIFFYRNDKSLAVYSTILMKFGNFLYLTIVLYRNLLSFITNICNVIIAYSCMICIKTINQNAVREEP